MSSEIFTLTQEEMENL